MYHLQKALAQGCGDGPKAHPPSPKAPAPIKPVKKSPIVSPFGKKKATTIVIKLPNGGKPIKKPPGGVIPKPPGPKVPTPKCSKGVPSKPPKKGKSKQYIYEQ